MGDRRARFRSARQLEGMIDDYFARCAGRPLINAKTGEPALDRNGAPIIIDARPPTMTGLALALGFATRAELLAYRDEPRYEEIVRRAKSRVEQFIEEQLFDHGGSTGARFSLQNNFRGWNGEAEGAPGAGAQADVLEEVRRRMEGEPPPGEGAP